MTILVINAGSSSLKYQLINSETQEVLAKGQCERIGIDGHMKHTSANGKSAFDQDVSLPTHGEAIGKVLELLVSSDHGVIAAIDEIDAVGHRVVHGGERFTKSVLIDEAVMDAIRACIPLAPLHNPANIMGIEACRRIMPGVPMVAVFDTAFHQTMPPRAYIYPIPYEYYENSKEPCGEQENGPFDQGTEE